MARLGSGYHDHLESGSWGHGLSKEGTGPELLGSPENPFPAQAAPRMDNSGGLSTSSTFHYPLAPRSHPGRQVRVGGGGAVRLTDKETEAQAREACDLPYSLITRKDSTRGFPVLALHFPTGYSVLGHLEKLGQSGKEFLSSGTREWEQSMGNKNKVFLGDEVRASAQVRRLETPLTFQRGPSPPHH